MRSVWWAGLGLGIVACTDVATQVRTRAAHDFGCSEEATQITDEEVGVYRIEGCGLAATYRCTDGVGGVTTNCQQLNLAKVEATEGGEKPQPGSGLAKSP